MEKYRVLRVGEIKREGDFLRRRSHPEFKTKIGTLLTTEGGEVGLKVTKSEMQHWEFRRPIKPKHTKTRRKQSLTRASISTLQRLPVCCNKVKVNCKHRVDDKRYSAAKSDIKKSCLKVANEEGDSKCLKP